MHGNRDSAAVAPRALGSSVLLVELGEVPTNERRKMHQMPKRLSLARFVHSHDSALEREIKTTY